MEESYWLNNVKHDFIHDEINREIFMEWIKEFDIEKIYDGIPIWPKMHGRKFQAMKELSYSELVPFSKQSEMYERWNRSRVLAVHFYGEELSESDEAEIELFASTRGLSLYWLAFDESWYSPGVSVTAVFEISDLEKYLNYIENNRQYDGKANTHWI